MPPTMEETMGAVFDAAQAAETPPADSAFVEALAEPVATGTVVDDRPRGPDGKFIAKTVETPEAAPATQNPAVSAPTQAAAETPSAPASWTAESKAAWAAIPPAIQAEILKRETDVAKGFDERAAKLKTWEPLEPVLGPRRQQLTAQYGSVETALNELFQLSDYAARDPRGFIDMFAKSRGVDLGQPTAETDPDSRVAALQKQVNDLTGHIQSRIQAEQTESLAQLSKAVEAFKASGKAPHFEDVRADMIELSKAYPSDSIEQLYDRAAFANPTIRARILEDQRSAERAEQEKTRKAEEAKRIEQTNVSTRGAKGGSPSAPKDMRTEMAEVYDRMNAA